MRRTWTWTFDLPPDELWPVLADTNRFNEAMGLPTYVLEETPQANGTILRRGRGKAAGFTLEWEEKPYEWIVGRHFRQARVFTKGPFRRFGPVFDLEPVELPGGAVGSKVTYALDWEPLTLMGRLFGARLARQAGEVVGKRILEAVAFAKGARATHFDLAPPELPQGARERAAALAAEIDRSPYGNGLGRPLADRVLTAMATDLLPHQAQAPGARARCPAARRDRGLPRRRAGRASHHEVGPALHQLPRRQGEHAACSRELPRGAHCPSCNIDYDRDFEKNVELSFAPAPTVRPLLGRRLLPLAARWRRRTSPCSSCWRRARRARSTLDLPPGSYRLRTLASRRSCRRRSRCAGGAFPGLRITASGVEAMPPGDGAAQIAFANDAGFELAALIEDRTWTRDALTAPEVISLQVFRDLFAEATLRPGDEAGVSQVALLFSDLQGSTALYERVGDAVAFNMVREHFALLAVDRARP